MRNKLQEQMATIIMGVFAVFFLTAGISLASAGEWTWMSGDNQINQAGTYGTKGAPHMDNMPGARQQSISWTDGGNLWLFGGHGEDSEGSSGFLNDLWRYDPESTMWTWISGEKEVYQVGIYGTKGAPHMDNIPGTRRSSISWTGIAGKLWLFGGYGYNSEGSSGYLNDLWCYDPDTNMWTWISGESEVNQMGTYGTKGTPHMDNIPGTRHESISWTGAAGKLWLFGGYGYDSEGSRGWLNDLWRYDPDTNMWTWISGDNQTNQAGTYGTKGTPHMDNIPGTREQSISWTDGGNFWLFGGWGEGSEDSGYLNDLWRYDPDTNMWTWMSGDSQINQVGTYGTKGLPQMENIPSTRRSSISWTGSDGKLWLFGGYGYDSEGSSGYLNDLWRYDPDTNMWTWISGDIEKNQAGTYGIKGTPHMDNIPGTRHQSISWTGSVGKLWLFGGNGIDGEGADFRLNDLWRYELPDCVVDGDCLNGRCEENICVDYGCTDDDCDDGLYCNGLEVCLAGECVAGVKPCDESESCDEASDQCLPDGCDVEWDLDFDCDVDKDDSKVLKLRQKAEKIDLKDQQKVEKDAMKAALGSSGACENEWDLNEDCDVDKDDSKILKLRQKAEKTDLKDQQKAEKDEMKAALQ